MFCRLVRAIDVAQAKNHSQTVAATIRPIRAPLDELGMAVIFGVATVLLVWPRAGTISRVRGLAPLVAYAGSAFMTTTQAR